MKRILIALTFTCFFCACGKKIESPTDSKGATPESTFIKICELIIDGNLEEAQRYYSSDFIDEFITTKNVSFSEYTKHIAGWKKEWLKTKPMGNDYNENVWRVKMIPDEGKGANNQAVVVYDFHIIDGVWKVVFWNHYPKTS